MPDSLKLKDKQITVMGLGLHGGAVGTVKWLYEQGAKVLVTDMRSEEELKESVEKLKELKGVEFILGEHREKDFTETDMVVRNPGVRRGSKYLKIAREAGVAIEMDSSLFFKHSVSRDIIGVTGSKGKTTTALAIAHLLKEGNKNVVTVGVEGVSPLNELRNVTESTTVVFELSSWRLEVLDEQRISPLTAVVTSLYEDHLNTYDSFEKYIETKKAIVKYQKKSSVAILNYDDELVREWASEIKGNLYWYSKDSILQENGIYVDGSEVKIRKGGEITSLFSAETLSVLDEHTARNVLAGVLLASIRGGVPTEINHLLGDMEAVPHRLEKVREIKGVLYVNDTTATIPEATMAALRSFSKKKLVLILGGNDKGLNFEELIQRISEADIRTIVFLPGDASTRMLKDIKKTTVPVLSAINMEDAVRQASEVTKKGDVVLLSPAATSFGLFKHEFDRGNQFKEAVNNI